MRFTVTTGLSRSSLSAVRRPRRIVLLKDDTRYRYLSRRFYGVMTAGSKHLGVAPSVKFLSVPSRLPLLTTKRFEATISQAAVPPPPLSKSTTENPSSNTNSGAVSEQTRLRHRRGAHRRRGGAMNAAPAVPAEAPAAEAAPSKVSPVLNREVEETVESAPPAVVNAPPKMMKLKRKRRASLQTAVVSLDGSTAALASKATAAAGVEGCNIAAATPPAQTVRDGEGDVAEGTAEEEVDADAAAIVSELMKATSVKGLNGHATAGKITSPSHAKPAEEEKRRAAEMEGDAVDEDDEAEEHIGVRLKGHRRSSRRRSGQKRRGTHAAQLAHPESAEKPSAAAPDVSASVAPNVPEKAAASLVDSLTASRVAAVATTATERHRPPQEKGSQRDGESVKATTPHTKESSDVAETAADEEDHDEAPARQAPPSSRSRRGKRGRAPPPSSSSSPPPSSASPTGAVAAAAGLSDTTGSNTAATPKLSISSFSLLTTKTAGASSEKEEEAADAVAAATTASAHRKSQRASLKSAGSSAQDPEAAVQAVLQETVENEKVPAAAQTTLPAGDAEDAATAFVGDGKAVDSPKDTVKLKKKRGRKRKMAVTETSSQPAAVKPEAAAVITAGGAFSSPSDNTTAAIAETTSTGRNSAENAVETNNDNSADRQTKHVAADATTTATASVAASALATLSGTKRLAAQLVRRRWQRQKEAKSGAFADDHSERGVASSSNEKKPPEPEAKATTTAQDATKIHTEAPAHAEEAPESTKASATKRQAGDATVVDTTTTAPPKKKRGRGRPPKRQAVTVVAEESDAAASPQDKPTSLDAADAKEETGVSTSTRSTPSASVASTAATTAADVLSTKKGPTISEDEEEARRDAEVAAAVSAALAQAAAAPHRTASMQSADAITGEAEREEMASTPLTGAAAAVVVESNHASAKTNKPPRALSTLIARSQNIVSAPHAAGAVTDSAVEAATGTNKSSSSKNSHSSGGGHHSSKSGGGSGGNDNNNKGVSAKDTLFSPDYRERVLQIFDQLAEINNALGERYKAQSYTYSVERLKRGDKVFQLLPPNLLPLPEDHPKWKAPVVDATTDPDVAAAVRKRAAEVGRNREKRRLVLSPDNLIPGLGHKLHQKIVEILTTGDLEELHVLEAKPIIRAIRELTQVHGFGPRTAIEFFKKYNITTVKELQEYAVKKGELDMSNKKTGKPAGLVATTGPKVGFHLNDAQRVGLVYYKDMCHRIPHDEGRLHEAFLKLRLRKYLGKEYELVVCGSYRRQVETAGDIDVLLSRTRDPGTSATLNANGGTSGGKPRLPASEVLAAFLEGLKADKYIEATLAQGPTKFMGLCRLRALPPPSASSSADKKDAGRTPAAAAPAAAPRFRARRLDVRFVDVDCLPAAMLYFTGSKNFNVIMRSEAVKKHSVLNEYGLFRKFTRRQQAQRQERGEKPYNLHEMITRLAKFGFEAIKEVLAGNHPAPTEGEEAAATDDGAAAADASTGSGNAEKVTSAGKKIRKKSKEKRQQEIAALCEVAKVVEKQRVKVFTEKEVFDAVGMDYVSPKDRNI